MSDLIPLALGCARLNVSVRTGKDGLPIRLPTSRGRSK
jgi:hypothetical protein